VRGSRYVRSCCGKFVLSSFPIFYMYIYVILHLQPPCTVQNHVSCWNLYYWKIIIIIKKFYCQLFSYLHIAYIDKVCTAVLSEQMMKENRSALSWAIMLEKWILWYIFNGSNVVRLQNTAFGHCIWNGFLCTDKVLVVNSLHVVICN